jgi:protein-disulfide isomerase
MSPVQSDEEDLTRKQRREQAREHRKELEQAEAARAVRRTRLTQLGVVVAVVVVAIIAVLVATGSGGSSKPVAKNSSQATKIVQKVSSLLGGIPQQGTVLGNPKAPVTLQYFADLECPICKDFTLGALESLVAKWVRPGKLKIEYRSLETATREPEVFRLQQLAALAAGKQNKMWQFAETFYNEQGEENSGYVTEQYLQNLAQQVPRLDLAKWTAARNDPALAGVVTSDAQLAASQGFTGTPSFLIGKTGGPSKVFSYTSLTDPSGFNTAIESLLKA